MTNSGEHFLANSIFILTVQLIGLAVADVLSLIYSNTAVTLTE